MNRDQRETHGEGADPRLAKLAARLREEGQAPRRDLWPGIEAAIAAGESRRLDAGRRRPDPVRWAVAAAVALLVVVGGWRLVHEPGAPGIEPAPTARLAAVTAPDPMVVDDGGLPAIDAALDEVNAALRDDPENRSLTNLAVMLHRSRGRVLRQSETVHITGS